MQRAVARSISWSQPLEEPLAKHDPEFFSLHFTVHICLVQSRPVQLEKLNLSALMYTALYIGQGMLNRGQIKVLDAMAQAHGQVTAVKAKVGLYRYNPRMPELDVDKDRRDVHQLSFDMSWNSVQDLWRLSRPPQVCLEAISGQSPKCLHLDTKLSDATSATSPALI